MVTKEKKPTTPAATKESNGRSIAVGPRDAKKAYRRCESVLFKLEPDIRIKVMDALVRLCQLSDLDEVQATEESEQ